MKLPVQVYERVCETKKSYFVSYMICDDNDRDICEANDRDDAERIAKALNSKGGN